MSSRGGKNGFVAPEFCFVAAPATKHCLRCQEDALTGQVVQWPTEYKNRRFGPGGWNQPGLRGVTGPG